MANNFPPETLLGFIENDFRAAWEALAAVPGDHVPRGNFMFARQALTLLELACRMAATDSAGRAHPDLSTALQLIDSRYFTKLPGECWSPGRREFLLPYVGPESFDTVIAAVFDLVRNGQAHQYQQISVDLVGGGSFDIALSGAKQSLAVTSAAGRPTEHLALVTLPGDHQLLRVRTDQLFLDLASAVSAARIGSRGLAVAHLTRGDGASGGTFKFSSAALNAALRAGGHC